MPSRDRVQDLIRLVEANRVLDAMEEYYAADLVMEESNGVATVGKPANVERERAFFGAISEPRNRAESVVVDGDHVAIRWVFTFTGGDGKRVRMDQVAYQTWRGDQIVHERFYYDSASLAA